MTIEQAHFVPGPRRLMNRTRCRLAVLFSRPLVHLKRHVIRYHYLYTIRCKEVMEMRALTPNMREGMSRSALYRGAKAGRWERIGRGVYLPANAPPMDWDQIEAATRRPDATICLVSALAHYDLTDTIPDALDAAIPRGTRAPSTDSAIRWHHFDKNTFGLGREEIPVPGSEQTIGIYTPERTIADCFRLRSSIGYEIARDATKEWLRRGGKPADLMQIATQLPRAKSPVFNTLELLS